MTRCLRNFTKNFLGVAFISNPGNYNVKNEKNTRIKCVCVCVCVCVWGGGGG